MRTKRGTAKVLYNGKIFTVDKNFSIAQAVSIRDGKFLAVGNNEQVKASVPEDAEFIDLREKTVVPGFVDSHNHMLQVALEKAKLSVADARSMDDILAIISDACKRLGPGKWIETSQMRFEPKQLKENRSPNRWELDKVSPNNPVIHEEHGHYSVVNSYALRLININKDTLPPRGGVITKDPKTGEPTGWLGETALDPIKALLPRPSHSEKVKLLEQTMRDYNELGITTVVETFTSSKLDDIQVYRDLWKNGNITVRSRILLAIDPWSGRITFDQIKMGREAVSRQSGLGDAGNDMLRIDGLKSRLDGGSQGTLFREPYMLISGEQEDPNWRGIMSMPREELKELCSLVARSGWRLAVHCAGDAAMDILLDVWDEVNRDAPITGKHWVLLHGQFPRQEHLGKIKNLGIQIATQPTLTYTMAADWMKWWGEKRANYADPTKYYLDNGIKVGGGSDAFYGEWNPVIMIHFDVTRKSKWAGVVGKDYAITREQSLRFHTIDAARISGDDDKIGSIEPGKLADLVVLSDDILNCSIEKIKDIKVLATMVGGEIVYEFQKRKIFSLS